MYCQGRMARGSAPFHIDRKDVHISLARVPAWVCTQCGEAYFDDTEVNAIQAIIRAADVQARRTGSYSGLGFGLDFCGAAVSLVDGGPDTWVEVR